MTSQSRGFGANKHMVCKILAPQAKIFVKMGLKWAKSGSKMDVFYVNILTFSKQFAKKSPDNVRCLTFSNVKPPPKMRFL